MRAPSPPGGEGTRQCALRERRRKRRRPRRASEPFRETQLGNRKLADERLCAESWESTSAHLLEREAAEKAGGRRGPSASVAQAFITPQRQLLSASAILLSYGLLQVRVYPSRQARETCRDRSSPSSLLSCSSQPMEELSQEVIPGKEVECLTNRLQAHFRRELCALAILPLAQFFSWAQSLICKLVWQRCLQRREKKDVATARACSFHKCLHRKL